MENLIKILWLIPLDKEKMMFISYTGAFSDSPKYIFMRLKEQNQRIKYVWAVNDSSVKEEEISGCKKVKFGSLSYIKEICTSNIVITNNFLNTYIPRRKGQEIINTWHGGSPLKTVGMVREPVSDFDRYFYEKHARKYSLYLSSSKFMTEEVFQKSFTYKGRVFNCGLPRNAILFRDLDVPCKKVSEYFDIPIDQENGIILYAPTFRGDAKNAKFISTDKQFNIQRCIDAVELKFEKKYRFLFRSHYFDKNLPSDCFMATEYPDMQELLAAADILITDYSSCMGDMCLMDKPVFLYAPDLPEYMGERGFYWDIFSLPFPVSVDEEELLNSIADFNICEYKKQLDEYLKRLGSYECHDSDILFANYLTDWMKKDEINDR